MMIGFLHLIHALELMRFADRFKEIVLYKYCILNWVWQPCEKPRLYSPEEDLIAHEQ